MHREHSLVRARFHYEDTSDPGPLTANTETRTRPWVRRSGETVAFWSSPPPVKMMNGPGPPADPQPIGSRDRRGYVFLGVAYRFGESAAFGKAGRYGGGERAAGAVGIAGFDALANDAHRRRGGDEYVDTFRAASMAALH